MSDSRPELTLPALRGLGGLANTKPVLIVDTRERDPLPFDRLTTRPGTLTTGDYSIAGLEEFFAVERKTVADLVSCCMGENRERFERELHRLRGFRFKRLLIVGSELEIKNCNYISRIKPQSVFGSLDAWEMRFDLPVVFRISPELAGRQIERWAFWFTREYIETANELLRIIKSETAETHQYER